MLPLFISRYFQNVFMIPAVKEITRLKLALAIPTGMPILLAKEAINIYPLVAEKNN